MTLSAAGTPSSTATSAVDAAISTKDRSHSTEINLKNDKRGVIPDLLNISSNYHRHRRLSESSVTPKSSDTNKTNNSSGGRWTYITSTTGANNANVRKKGGGELEPHMLAGLTLAGLGATILHTLHTFQVDQLRLVLPTSITGTGAYNPYAAGGVILKTTSYVVGAWLVDSYAAPRRSNRTDCIGLVGLALVIVFLWVHVMAPSNAWLPLLRQHPPYWMFECLRSVFIVVLASPVIQDHRMNPSARIYFMASGQCINLVTSVLVRWMCQNMVANDNTMSPQGDNVLTFGMLVLASIIVCGVFTIAQSQISTTRSLSLFAIRRVLAPLTRRKVKEHVEDDFAEESDEDDTIRAKLFHTAPICSRRSLDWRRVVRDLSLSTRFLMWIGMEVWMEAHIAIFHVYYLHHVAIIVSDNEVHNTAIGPWALVTTGKVAAIITYLPMLLGFGYTGVYRVLFYMVGGLSTMVLLAHGLSLLDPAFSIVFFFLIATVAVHAAGFQLAMADLSLDIHYRHVLEGRMDEPSLAGVLIGVNALICKPAAYFAAMLVTNTLASPYAICVWTVLPLVGSSLQLWFWNRYDLTPRHTATMRNELHRDDLSSDLPR